MCQEPAEAGSVALEARAHPLPVGIGMERFSLLQVSGAVGTSAFGDLLALRPRTDST